MSSPNATLISPTKKKKNFNRLFPFSNASIKNFCIIFIIFASFISATKKDDEIMDLINGY